LISKCYLYLQCHKNDLRAGTPLLRRKAERVGAVQPGEEKVVGRLYCSLPVLKRAYKKAGEGLFTRACGDRTWGNGFKLKEGRFRLDTRKKFLTVRIVRHRHRLPGEAVAAPSLEVQGQAGRRFEQPGLVEGVPAHGRGVRTT